MIFFQTLTLTSSKTFDLYFYSPHTYHSSKLNYLKNEFNKKYTLFYAKFICSKEYVCSKMEYSTGNSYYLEMSEEY